MRDDGDQGDSKRKQAEVEKEKKRLGLFLLIVTITPKSMMMNSRHSYSSVPQSTKESS